MALDAVNQQVFIQVHTPSLTQDNGSREFQISESSGRPSVLSQPAASTSASESPENLLEMQMLSPTSDPRNQKVSG